MTAYEMRISDWSSDVCSSDLILISAGEHDSLRQAAPTAQRIPLTPDGVVELDALAALLEDAPAGSLVSVMLANNETGVIQPIAEVEIGRASCRESVCQYV